MCSGLRKVEDGIHGELVCDPLVLGNDLVELLEREPNGYPRDRRAETGVHAAAEAEMPLGLRAMS